MLLESNNKIILLKLKMYTMYFLYITKIEQLITAVEISQDVSDLRSYLGFTGSFSVFFLHLHPVTDLC